MAVESILSCDRDDHVTDVLVTNLTGAPIFLKSGVLLGSFEVCDSRSFHDPPHLVCSVSPNTDISHDTPDPVSQLLAR